MAEQRRGGTIEFQIDGELMDAVGNFTYNLGLPKRDSLVGADRVHGYSEKPQPAFIEGEIRDRRTLDLRRLVSATDATVWLKFAHGKGVVLRNAWFAGEGTGNSDEANFPIRFEGLSAEVIS
jgi:hypothetical protein